MQKPRISRSIWQEDRPAQILVAAAFLTGVWAFPRLPARVPVHWNIHGQPDGFGSAGFAAFFLPLLTAALYGLMVVLPALDPKQQNYRRFSGPYRWIRFGIVGFLVIIYWATLATGLGIPVPMDRVVPALMAVLALVLGLTMDRLEPNYFVGIRTPWTLADEETWRRTHRNTKPAWLAAGAVGLVGALIGGWLAFALSVGGLLGAAGYAVVYSYLTYRKTHPD